MCLLLNMQKTNFLHIPKTGGTALEHMMRLPHVHMLHPTNSSLLVIAREHDLKRVLKNDTLEFKRVNISPNSYSHPCERRGFESAPQSAWKLFSREYNSDFEAVYNRTFNSLEEWQMSCWTQHAQPCKNEYSSARSSDHGVMNKT